MSSRPYFKLFFSDLVGDTLHLRDAEFGSYMLLLGAMWNNGGRLPSDADRLARIGRCSAKVWARRWSVLSEFFDESEGFISSARMIKELQKVEHLTQERSAAGRKGAAAKALKSNNAGSANGQAKRKQPEPEPEPEDIPTVVDKHSVVGCADWPDLKVRGWMNDLIAEIGSGLLDPSKEPKLVTTMGVFLQWQRLGLSWHGDVIPIIAGSMAKQRGPVRSWMYFDAAMRERAEEIKNPKPVGGTNGKRTYATASDRREAYYAEIFGTDLARPDDGTVIDG